MELHSRNREGEHKQIFHLLTIYKRQINGILEIQFWRLIYLKEDNTSRTYRYMGHIKGLQYTDRQFKLSICIAWYFIAVARMFNMIDYLESFQ